MSMLFKVLKSERNAAAKFGKLVRELISSGSEEGKADVLACAQAIEEAFPVAKTDGKDSNRDERNGYLGSLRMALLRAGRELPTPVALKIKKVEGAWQLVVEQPKQADGEAAAPAEGDGEEAAPDVAQEEQQEALWAAVELVSSHLMNKAVRIALQTAIEKALKG